MTKNRNIRSLIVMLSVLSTIISTTFLISIIARGYIPEFDNGLKIKATGLLSATSIPKNAKVIINEKLYTTTDDSINLVPGDYQLNIVKDGYLPWNKKINIQKEMVYQAEASLFRSNPILAPITTQGVINPTVNGDLTQVVFAVTSSSTETKPGIYLVEMNYLSLVLNRYQPKLISNNPFSIGDTSINFVFSPNSKQIIVKSNLKRNQYLIDLSQTESKSNLVEILPTDEKVNLEWKNQSKLINDNLITRLPKIFTSTIATNPASISFSSDENKFLYSINGIYRIYDIEKNQDYQLGKQENYNSIFWLPKSNSLVYSYAGKIKSLEFDTTNDNTIYSNDFQSKPLLPQFDGDKVLVITATKSGTPYNIYTLTIR